jgi:two-component system, OmpR family, sensor kinase
VKAGRRATPDSDTGAIRRASRVVGWQIAAAATAIVALVVTAAVVFIVGQSQPTELLEKPRPGQSKIYVDSGDVLVALMVVGLVAIVIAGLLSWLAAARAVRPLGEALRMQRAFVADASHELRTPLSVLDARIQVLQRRLAPDDPHAEAVAEIRRDARGLIEVVNDLLLAAATQAPQGEVEVIDVNPVVEAGVDAMRVLAETRRVRIDLHGSVPVRARISAASINRCVVALLDNALSHSPDESTVTVTLRAAKNTFDLIVTDQGAGVQGIDPGRIFDRFAHSSAQRPRAENQSGRFGIGLALVRDIAVRHGGTVTLRDTSPTGTTIALTLPLN